MSRLQQKVPMLELFAPPKDQDSVETLGYGTNSQQAKGKAVD